MPENFRPRSKPKRDEPAAIAPLTTVQITEPRCHVCQHPQRSAIDRLIAIGTRHTEIERLFEVGRRSITNHADVHLNYDDAVIREIVLREAEKAQENIESGITAQMNRHLYLEVAVHKGLEALLQDRINVEPKDVVKVIELLQKLDTEQSSAGIETYRTQFNIIMQAIMEVCAPEVWQQIKARAQELWEDARVRNPEIEAPKYEVD